MRVIIVGGGKLGYFATKTLMQRGMDVKLIERNHDRCEHIANLLDVPVICSDGTTVESLSKAGADKADVLLAVTGTDQDNIVACELGKHRFNIKKVIARANNPKNIDIMKMLGADIVVCSTKLITDLIEMEVDTSGFRMLLTLNNGESEIIELVVPKNWRYSGHKLSELGLPRNCIIVSLTRNGRLEIPRGDTVLLPGDRLIVFLEKESQKAIEKIFH
ncbi:MAG TPA: TrkA family potassium uptake protein [Clostridiales bacterium]|nr:TrkA family potassium uptake protein [Clostridiales bacterium]